MEYFMNNLFLLTAGLYMTGANIRFANEGEAMQLNCPYNRVNSWQSGTNDFLVVCEGEKPMINVNLSLSNRINISSDCTILTITNFTKEDAGTYVCFITQKDMEKTDVYVKHAIHVTLRELQIEEANDVNLVQGTEGKLVTLTCSLQGGSSNDMLCWMKDNVTLKSGKPPSLKYTFMADRSVDMKEFTCRGTIMKISYFLTKKVTVNIYLKPSVFITVLSNSSIAKTDKNVIVRQGQHMELKCLQKYNASGEVVIFSWLFNKKFWKNNTNMLVLNNVSPEKSGEYICIAQNRAGIRYESVNMTVAELQINEANDVKLVQGMEGKNITLTCSMQGGSSNDMLYWNNNNMTFKSGKPPSLKYTFIADQSDHMKEFTCRGTIMKINYFLTKKVTVNLYLKPTVFITVLSNSSVAKIDKNVIVRQGQHMELKCLEKYNASGDVVIISWLFNKIVWENDTNMLVLNNINPEKSGEYICRAQNRAGINYDAVNITVADRPEMPQNFQVVALKLEIIVKWRAGNSGGMQQTFLVEYRSRFELEWSVITAEGKTSKVIDGLQMGTVYFVRMFSRNILGESNTTDEIIIKTVAGNHHLVIQNCSWEIGVISSAAVVVFFLCLCGVKATPKRFCLNMAHNRSNRSQVNETIPETHGAQYDEIDSVYYNPNINDRPEPSFDSTQHETPLISGNGRGIGNITTDNVRTGSFNHEIIQSDTDSNILRADNVSARSSSDDSYLVPSRNYINLEVGFTDEHSHQIGEPENLSDGLSASNSESSETHIKSDHKYETLATANIGEHSYETTTET
ncbi:unnamed protein product [Mytilus coruscus]|uniref:NCAM n=1 Tax=Mytilus coruscus TaxID=42192 RepID=A0A6J8ETX0_MYTCO|nr:unnamed protein product [Mytilus coruscus]